MTTRTAPRKRQRPARPPRAEAVPSKPGKHLWEADRARAFEAGVRWFLAVSRGA
jgi:hypothetical protein